MRIIVADSGHDFELSNTSLSSTASNELLRIKLEIEKTIQVKAQDQILISSKGIQLKESDRKIGELHSTIVVFNRRLLQDIACVDRLINDLPHVTEDLIESSSIPSLKEMESMKYIYETEERDQELFETLDHIVQVVLQVSNHRYSIIDQFVREIHGQSIALNAALNNLESHVRTAHQNFGKFDRIAQREFAKHAIAIANIDLDIDLLQNINMHPRVCHISNSMRLLENTTLGSFVPLKELTKIKQGMLKRYDQLVSATLEQKNKVAYLHQQTSNVSTQRTTSEIVIQRVQKLKQEALHFTESLLEIEKKIKVELKRRQNKDLFLDQKPPPSLPRSISSVDINHDIYTMMSPPTTAIQQKRKKIQQNILQDAIRSLYLHETLIHQAEKSVIEEKQASLSNFIRCMQAISQVEESVTQIYPRLAELEKDIKMLRFDIDKGTGATAKRIIAGYGMLLIELWRRDKYTEIVMGNANLLQNLFGKFGQLEQTYRKNFEKGVICLDKNHMLSSTTGNNNEAILPFQMQNIDDPPMVCLTSVTSQSEEDTSSIFVTKKEVEEYIQFVHSYYSNNTIMPSSSDNEKRPSSRDHNKTVEDNMSRDVSFLLSRTLEREAKRIRSGLVQLGLPGSSSSAKPEMASNIMMNKESPSSAPSSPSSIVSSFSDMKLASSTVQQPNMSSALLLQQQQNWELEKASILRQSQEYRKYIEDLCTKHGKDRIKYEKDKQTLLRKLYNQDKKLEVMKQGYTDQIQDYQIKMQNAEKDFEIKEEEWKQKYETLLQTEQEKYDRRLNGFKDRMNLDELQVKSAPTSPTNSTFLNGHRQRFVRQPLPATVSQERYDRDVNELNEKINAMAATHQQEIEQLQRNKQFELDQLAIDLQNQHTTQLKQVGDALQSEHKGKNDEFLQLINSLQTEKQSYVERLAHFDTLKEQMDHDRAKEFDMHQTVIQNLKAELEELKERHRSKLLQMNEKFSSSETRLKSLFMNENQQLTMQYEARVENLVAEHKSTLQELKETFENEKEVVMIQHQTEMENKTREFGMERKALEEKLQHVQTQADKLRHDYAKHKSESAVKLNELINLQRDHRNARRIANDMLAVSQIEKVVDDASLQLSDLLGKALSNITRLHSRCSIMEQSMDSFSPYAFGLSPYGY